MCTRGKSAHSPARSHLANVVHKVATSIHELNGCLTISGRQGHAETHSSRRRSIAWRHGRCCSRRTLTIIVHVKGCFGSVVEVEDPRVPSFVVDTLDPLAPNCSVRAFRGGDPNDIGQAYSASRAGNGRNDGHGICATGHNGERWHEGRLEELFAGDSQCGRRCEQGLVQSGCKSAFGVRPFDSGFLQPGQSFSRV